MPANTPRGYTYPLYGDPANFPAQVQDFAQDVDTDVAAQVAATAAALNAPSARVSATANQAIPANVATLVTFATEDYDNANLANLGVNNERITFATVGTYLIHAEVNCLSNNNATVGARQLRLEFSLGAALNVSNSLRGAQFTDSELSLTWLYKATNVADFVRIRIYQDSGAALNIDTRSMSVTKVGP